VADLEVFPAQRVDREVVDGAITSAQGSTVQGESATEDVVSDDEQPGGPGTCLVETGKTVLFRAASEEAQPSIVDEDAGSIASERTEVGARPESQRRRGRRVLV
jgi:hypothetical protein